MPVRHLAFSPDGATLASAAGHPWPLTEEPYQLRLWDTASGQERLCLVDDFLIASLAFSPDGTVLAAGNRYGGRVWLYDPATGARRLSVQGGTPAAALCFAPDSRTLTTAGLSFWGRHLPRRPTSFAYGVWRWDLTTRRQVVIKKGQRGPLQLSGSVPWRRALNQRINWFRDPIAALSPDGQFLAGSLLERTARLWRLSSARLLAELPALAAVTDLRFSPDGRLLAVAGGCRVALWDVAARTRARRALLRGHRKLVRQVAFAPDGQTLATAGEDGVVRLFDVGTGKERAAYDWGIGKVRSVAFAPDGMRAAAGGDTDIVLWDVDSD